MRGQRAVLSSALVPPVIVMLALQVTSGFCDRQLVNHTQSHRSDRTGSPWEEREWARHPQWVCSDTSQGDDGSGQWRETDEAHATGSCVEGERGAIDGPRLLRDLNVQFYKTKELTLLLAAFLSPLIYEITLKVFCKIAHVASKRKTLLC